MHHRHTKNIADKWQINLYSIERILVLNKKPVGISDMRTEGIEHHANLRKVESRSERFCVPT